MIYKKLGILGGLGPLASVYFTDLLVNGTVADSDQSHIPFYLYNDVLIPDRSAYILGESEVNPLPELVNGVKELEKMGSDLIVVTCNTAHYFYDDMSNAVNVPVLNIIEAAIDAAKENVPGMKKLGVVSTTGTIKGEVYKKVAEKKGLLYATPSEDSANKIMALIYDVKVGKKVDPTIILDVAKELEDDGCDAIILGCTELSVVSRQNHLTDKDPCLVDAMTALAQKCVTLCGKDWKDPTSICIM